MTAPRDTLPTTDISDPENSEQHDDGQAQDVAADALHRGTEPGGETEHGGGEDRGAVIPEDTPDLVDRMNAMVSSGHIDNDAFAGEPQMDDEEGILGDTDRDDDA